ncbi:MAG: TdeIII family type II restriction endonuclease [Saprospiraceae bacterium]
MENNEKINAGINKVITEMMERVMNKVLFTDPFIKENHHLKKPLYAALVPDEIFKGSHFERRFVTPFGGVWEKLAQVVAQEYHGHCEMGKTITGQVGMERLRRIQEVLNRLESGNKNIGKTEKDWNEVLAYILKGKGKMLPTHIKTDLFIDSKRDNQTYAFFIKGDFPNRFQTKYCKENVLKLLAMNNQSIDNAYFTVLSDFNTELFSKQWFNFKNDDSLLIDKDFWELIGGKSIYNQLISIANEIGKNSKKNIYTDVFEITNN